MSTATSSAQITAINQHVPAWKRLGLKLKYAKDTAEPTSQRVNNVEITASKRSTSKGDGGGQVSKPAKKRKTSTESSREDEPEVRKATKSSSAPSTEDSHAIPRESQSDVGDIPSIRKAKHKKFDVEA